MAHDTHTPDADRTVTHAEFAVFLAYIEDRLTELQGQLMAEANARSSDVAMEAAGRMNGDAELAARV